LLDDEDEETICDGGLILGDLGLYKGEVGSLFKLFDGIKVGKSEVGELFVELESGTINSGISLLFDKSTDFKCLSRQ
jgi:hypothetical protein